MDSLRKLYNKLRQQILLREKCLQYSVCFNENIFYLTAQLEQKMIILQTKKKYKWVCICQTRQLDSHEQSRSDKPGTECHQGSATGKTKENKYYRIRLYFQGDNFFPSMSLVMRFRPPDLSYRKSCGLDPLREGTRSQGIDSHDSHTSPCLTTP